MNPEEDIVLVVERDELDEAVRRCIRIGLDRVVGWTSPSTLAVALELIGGGETIDEIASSDLPAMLDAGAALLDVRTAAEAAHGAIEGAVNIPHTRLRAHLDEMPVGEPIIIHCAGGSRSSAACSMLARAGRSVINLAGGYRGWTAAMCKEASCQTEQTR